MVELICKVDKSILGGVIIETEDTVIDGSLKTKLRNVKEVMKA
jgi:F0F1-type ATP synthase delta subunit